MIAALASLSVVSKSFLTNTNQRILLIVTGGPQGQVTNGGKHNG